MTFRHTALASQDGRNHCPWSDLREVLRSQAIRLMQVPEYPSSGARVYAVMQILVGNDRRDETVQFIAYSRSTLGTEQDIQAPEGQQIIPVALDGRAFG